MVIIRDKEYKVCDYEFNKVEHKNFNNLNIIDKVGLFERLVSLMVELSSDLSIGIDNLIIYKPTHGGFIPINISNNRNCNCKYKNVFLVETAKEHAENIRKNMESQTSSPSQNIQFLEFIDCLHESVDKKSCLVYSDNNTCLDLDFIQENQPFLIAPFDKNISKLSIYEPRWIKQLSNTNLCIYVPQRYVETFEKKFFYYFQDLSSESCIFDYDNLNHLCIMVKNGGPQFQQMLLDNMPFFDRWTILDTGSTDNTIETIHKVLVGKKKGNLYQEPFINFRDSRNRCLDLAGESCKFITMLDDTYVIKGKFREFLNEVRGDQYSSSFTFFIHGDDTIYGSNRVIKAETGLRYIHTIHEVITDKNNRNIVIPDEITNIEDRRFDYMEKRTKDRKQLDLKLLYDEVKENPHDPRAYYYLAQTYNGIEDYENSLKYFLKRIEYPNSGFHQEYVDSIFEAARTMNFRLNRPWEECEAIYKRCYMADPSRPEALYFIGIHYYLEGGEKNMQIAYEKFKQGFEIGFPEHCQYSLKPTLSYHFLPKFLCKICYGMKDYVTGLKSAELFLKHNKPSDDSYGEIASWHAIYVKLVEYEKETNTAPIKVTEKKLFCFVADGGFNKWSGSSILTTGVGGSETYIIEMARYMQKRGEFDVYVFCNCEEVGEVFEGVTYMPLHKYYRFIKENYVHSCMVSRFSEYLPVTFESFVENIYFVIHDLSPSGFVIPMNIKLKKIFCLTEWHVEYFTSAFPALKDITEPFYYGIDFGNFMARETRETRETREIKNNEIPEENENIVLEISQTSQKVPHRFIYSSFPNRGLFELLKMWPRIYEHQPNASLHIYCDVNHKWSNDVEPEKMQNIKMLLEKYDAYSHGMNIYYHGWVNKKTLANAWLTADIWFYPCTFMETFCLTALEAAATKTLVITNHLAALQNSVGNRGIIIKGDATTQEWHEKALTKIFKVMDSTDNKMKNVLIDANYDWAKDLSWENRASVLLDTFILKDKFEYKGMYNWTHDLPKGEKKHFLDAIEYFNTNYKKPVTSDINTPVENCIKVLEIGTYTGMSLIHIVSLIPNSIGIGLDIWSDYKETGIDGIHNNIVNLGIEKSFEHNVRLAGLQDRIKGVKGDSTKVLMNMIKSADKYDFIYVDGSHMLLDCYSDLLLAWEVLNMGGLMAIDDYLYNVNDGILVSPYHAVNKFLEKYKDNIKILHAASRVFVQKV
jgi:glycosyltransferase involved in cell wall biosynthesis/tetratricopeptide (TPR) repeat protein